jgi:hypothetical protein
VQRPRRARLVHPRGDDAAIPRREEPVTRRTPRGGAQPRAESVPALFPGKRPQVPLKDSYRPILPQTRRPPGGGGKVVCGK